MNKKIWSDTSISVVFALSLLLVPMILSVIALGG